jgi:hypothetical protein
MRLTEVEELNHHHHEHHMALSDKLWATLGENGKGDSEEYSLGGGI